MAKRTASEKLMMLDHYMRILAKHFYLQPAAERLAAELTHNELFACDVLGRRGRCTMTELAKECGLALSSATGIMDRLVERGYVKRSRSDEDRRLVFVELTKRGEQVYQERLEAEMQMIITMMDALGPEEQETLLELLGKAVVPLGG